jgi:3-hydroxyisobutyrate dehydrogenase-like beta-hydroxyacid dehydrogenase
MRVGFIGLGNIGGAIARNLVADGISLSVSDTDRARCAALVDLGAAAAGSPEAVARTSEVTFLSLPTPDAVDQVAAGWLRGAAPGAILVDLSTNSPDRVRSLEARVRAAGCHLLDAPLSGGALGAQARMLMFMVGGEREVYEKVRSILDRIGRASFHLGPTGAGSTAKLVNSLVAFATTVASLEAFALATKAGIDLRAMVEVVRTGGAGNFFTDRAVEGIERRGGPAQFALELAAKDARLICELARAHGLELPLAGQVSATIESAVRAGMAGRDWTELPEWLERAGGFRYRLVPPAAEPPKPS